jgi:hypothetical protein
MMSNKDKTAEVPPNKLHLLEDGNEARQLYEELGILPIKQDSDYTKCKSQIEQDTARRIKDEIDDLIAVGTETTDFIIIDKDNWQQYWEKYGVK